MAAAGLVLFAATSVNAATIDVDAPEAVAKLLRAHARVLKKPPAAIDAVEERRLRVAATEEFSALLATEGWFAPSFEFRRRGEGESAHLQIAVSPGEPVRVGAVDVRFAGHLGQVTSALAERRQQALATWSLPVGEVFSQAAWDQAKQQILRAVSGEDYALARLRDTEAEIDVEARSARLTVVVDSGPLVRFGQTRYEGLERVPEAVVGRLSRIEAGAPYDREQLLDFQAALQNSAYFSSVVVDTPLTDAAAVEGAADSGPLLADVRVQVREAHRHRVAAGAGLSTETGAFLEATYGNIHLFDRGLDFRTGFRVDEQGGKTFADVYLPPNRDGFRDSVGAGYESATVEGLRTDRSSVGVKRWRHEGPTEIQLGLRYLSERARDSGLDQRTSALAASWEWTRRDVDDRFDPRQGTVLTVGLTGGGSGLGSQTTFLRSHGKVQGYWSPRADHVLTARLEAGYTTATDETDLPQEFLFRAGGVNSVRGYAYNSLGRKVGSAVRGDHALLTGSIEYTRWLDAAWGAAVFADAGNVDRAWQDIDLAVGLGAGARYKTPAGPLAVDVAWGERSRKLRLHFSVAITF
jgi:translocation and assembly module TamA